MKLCYEILDSKLQDVKVMDEEQVIDELEETIEEFSLRITQKTTLSTLKGSVHYHLKQGTSSGLLELTYWPKQKRVWVEIHHNRRADWNERMIEPFAEALAHRFQGRSTKA
jgi:hypothetical protein